MRLFASSILIVTMLVLGCFGQQQEKPKPCPCGACGGEIRCPANHSAWAECTKDGRCIGECFPIQKTARQQARIVLTYITKEPVPQELLERDKKRFHELLDRLLNGKEEEGVYRIEYEGRPMRFSFTETAVKLLEEARKSVSVNARAN